MTTYRGADMSTAFIGMSGMGPGCVKTRVFVSGAAAPCKPPIFPDVRVEVKKGSRPQQRRFQPLISHDVHHAFQVVG